MPHGDFDNLTGRAIVPISANYWLGISIAAHFLLLALLFAHRGSVLAPSQLPGDRFGHQLLLTYLPGQGSTTQTRAAAPPQHTTDVLPKLHVPRPAETAHIEPPSPAQSTTGAAGSDSLGQGDIQIASLLVHPRPTPDLSQLPSGTRGDVIVDIVIDTAGRVAKTTVEHGLGHGVDEAVLQTVQQWTFQPATRNGVPIASEQELLFHYEHG